MRNSHLIFVEPLASFNQQNRSPNQAANCRIWLRKCDFRLHDVKDTSDETACAQIHSKWRLVHAKSWELLSGCTFPASLLCRTRAALTWANKGLIQLSRGPFNQEESFDKIDTHGEFGLAKLLSEKPRRTTLLQAKNLVVGVCYSCLMTP